MILLTIFLFSRPVLTQESTKQLNELKQNAKENLEVSLNATDVAMRGTIYQNCEAEQSSCTSPPNQSTEALRERYD